MAIRELEFTALPETLEARPSDVAALVLIRLRGRPVGQALLPLETGRCTGLRARLLAAADSAFWEAWLAEDLGLPPAPRPAPAPAATIAVCTRDRPEDLERCIAALLALPDDGQEIIIVDNAPRTEATRDLVARFPQIRYLREPRPGLDVARNRALSEARTELVAFTDDDAAPDPMWLRALLRNFDDPLVMAATGPTLPLELDCQAQIDFQHYGGFLRGYKRMLLDAAVTDPFLGWHAGAGVNMALRRTVIDQVGLFDDALDAGTKTRAGGDADMFRRMLAAGYRIAHDPEALNWHRHRRSLKELGEQLHGYEVAGGAVLAKAMFHEGNWGAGLRFMLWLRGELTLVAARLLRRGGSPLAVSRTRIAGGFIGLRAYGIARRIADGQQRAETAPRSGPVPGPVTGKDR
ncbi:glycosyltransferase family 2 protein [Frigidibacter sp. MR17.24]|uniref:glycosyltransferase family 2 protein n=1 Tax=Frigidibacter sp. MR17.24 TaxID=3127345 RepID=UPI00301301D3